MAAVAHHGPEDHLVPGALGAADTACHPGLDENRDPLLVPARGGDARGRQIGVEDCLRLIFDRRDFAGEELAEGAITLGRHVAGHHVHQLVIHQGVDAFVRWICFVSEAVRRDLNHHEVPRDCGGSGIAVVGNVAQEYRDLLPRFIVEQLSLKSHRVFE